MGRLENNLLCMSRHLEKESYIHYVTKHFTIEVDPGREMGGGGGGHIKQELVLQWSGPHTFEMW